MITFRDSNLNSNFYSNWNFVWARRGFRGESVKKYRILDQKSGKPVSRSTTFRPTRLLFNQLSPLHFFNLRSQYRMFFFFLGRLLNGPTFGLGRALNNEFKTHARGKQSLDPFRINVNVAPFFNFYDISCSFPGMS